MAKEKTSPLAERLKAVRERIAKACDRAKRDPAEVTLIAVTKYAPPEDIRELLTLGVADLGESRVQNLVQRAATINEYHRRAVSTDERLPGKLRWHMIGHLQRNKVKQLLPHVSVVHSIDSLRLAEELEQQLERQDRKLPVMLQVNASEEPQKYGVAVGAAGHLAEQIATMKHIQLVGLMTMAAHGAAEKDCRFTFGRTREIFEDLRFNKVGGSAFKHLSMGMTDDFEIAIEEGATLVRIGSALFGGKAEGAEEEEE
ncbi:MAG: YggS family pyridoxal phosphate-dependent enzyme [Tepidisphaeraceae bacterium]